MKRLIVLSLFTVVVLSAWNFRAPAQAQSPGTDPKPTFISPTPGLYVNGWPPFTVSYPKEWVELPLGPGSAFHAGALRPDLPPAPEISMSVHPSPLPLENWARIFMPVYEQIATDIKVLFDMLSRLKDGTPTREVELEWVPKSGPKRNTFILMTKKDWAWVWIQLTDDKGRIRKDLREYAYSLTFLPGREEPVNVPPDVRAFLDMWCTDSLSDAKMFLAHYSNRFFHHGMNKAFLAQWLRNDPTPPAQQGATSCEATVTVFELRGDKAYVDGFSLYKATGDGRAWKTPLLFQQIINEHGQWKWYGNQK